MWPHSLVLGLGESAVCVGTDDAALAEQLSPWQLAAEPHGAPEQLVDYAIELHPPKPQHRAAPRLLPSLRHGTATLARSTDVDALRDGFLRILGSFVAPVPRGCVRVLGLPLLRDGAVELVPPHMADHLSGRWLHDRGFTPVPVASVVVDPLTLEARIDAPLIASGGSGPDAPALVAPIRRWWCAVPDPAAALGPGRFLAYLAHRIAPPASAADDRQGSDALAALVRLVHQLPPERIGFGPGELLARLGGSPPPGRQEGTA